ncbi:sensor histidine kinase [Streptomyces sp. 7R007]
MTSTANDVSSVLDVIRQPAWTVDARHRVAHANRPAASLLGHRRPADLLGTDGRPAEVPGTEAKSPTGVTAAPAHGRGTLTRTDGSLLPVEWSLIPLARSGGAAAVYVFRPGTGASTTVRERTPEERAARARTAWLDALRRREVAGALQHGAQERVTSLLLALGLVRERLAAEHVRAPVAELLERAVRDAEETLERIRRVTAELYPGVLRLRGLPAALTALAAQWPVPVDVSVNLRERLPNEVELHTYHLVREALGRAVRDARAGRVRVVAERDTELVVTVTDDGAALGTASLTALADRAAAVDGSVTVRHEPGKGTTVRAVIPVHCHMFM